MDLNENSLDLGSCTNPNHNHSKAISRAMVAPQRIGTSTLLLSGIDSSTYELQRKTRRNIAYQIQTIKGRAELEYQRLQLR